MADTLTRLDMTSPEPASARPRPCPGRHRRSSRGWLFGLRGCHASENRPHHKAEADAEHCDHADDSENHSRSDRHASAHTDALWLSADHREAAVPTTMSMPTGRRPTPGLSPSFTMTMRSRLPLSGQRRQRWQGSRRASPSYRHGTPSIPALAPARNSRLAPLNGITQPGDDVTPLPVQQCCSGATSHSDARSGELR